MSWLGGSLSSLTGQLSNLTKDILTEGTEEVSDHVTELRVCQEKLKELDSVCITQKVEIDRLKLLVREWQEKSEASELQINSISREYRTLLEEKEKEIKLLKQQHHEQQELKASFGGPDSGPAVLSLDSDGFEHVSYGGDEHDFGDSVAMQHDINRLRGEIHRLKSECKQWKSLAEQQNASKTAPRETGTAERGEDSALLRQIEELQQQLGYEKDQREQELSGLQDAHNHKLATVRRKHKEEVAELRKQLQELDWGAQGWQDESPSEVTTLKQRVSTLQEEVDSLKGEREDHLQQLSTLNQQLEQLSGDLAVQQAQTLHLQNQLTVAKEEVGRLEREHEQVCRDLYDTKQQLLDQLDANHADTLEVLSDLRQVRQHMDKSAIERRNKLLMEKDKIVSDLIESGEKKKELAQDVAGLETENQSLLEETEGLVKKLGDPDTQKLTADVVDNIEKENLLLKKRNVALQEQVALLEKAVQNVSKETRRHTEAQSVSDSGTLAAEEEMSDQVSLTSDLSDMSRRNLELDGEVTTLKAQIGRYESEIEKFELMRSDWQSEKEALEDVLIQLREQMRSKENALNVMEAQRGLLAVEKHEGESTGGLPDVVDSKDNLADIAEDMVELDYKVQQLTDANALLELERDNFFQEKENLLKELEEMKANASKSSEKADKSSDATDLNKSLREKEDELEELMSETDEPDEEKSSESLDLKKVLQQKQQEIDNLYSEIKVKTSEHKELEKEIDELKRKLRGKNEEIVNLSLEKEDMMSSLEELDNQHQEAMAHIIQIKDQLTKSNDELKKKLTASDKENDNLKEEIQKVKSQHMVNQTMESSNANELNHQIAELKEDNNRLRHEMDVCQGIVIKLKKELEAKDDQVNEMNMKLTSSAEALNNLHMDKKEMQDKINRLKEDQSKQSGRIKQLREENDSLKKSLQDTDTDKSLTESIPDDTVQIKKSELDDLEQRSEDLSKELEEVGEELREKRKEISNCQSDLSRLKETLEKEKRVTAERTIEIEKINAVLVEKDSEIQTLREEIFTLKKDCDKLNEESTRKHQECESFSRQLHALENELHTLKTSSSETGTENDNLSYRVEMLNNELTIFKDNLSSKNIQCDSLTEELKKAKDLLEDTTLRLHNKCEECNELEEKIEGLRYRVSQIIEEKDSEYGAKLMSATGELVLVKEELANKSQEWEKLDKELYVKDEDISKLKQEKYALAQQIKNISAENEEMRQKISSFEQLTFHTGTSVGESSESVDSALPQTSQLTELPTKSDSSSDSQSVKEEHIKELQDRLKSVEEQLLSSNEKLVQMEISNKENKEEVVQLNEMIVAKEREIASLSESLQTNQDNFASLQNTNSQLETKSLDYETKNQSLTSENASLALKFHELEMLLETLRNDKEKQHSEYLTLIKENERLQECNRILEADIKVQKKTVMDHEAGIADLNKKQAECLQNIENDIERIKTQEGVIEVLRQTSIQKDEEINGLQRKLTRARSLIGEEGMKILENELQTVNPNYNLPAIEYKEKQSIEFHEVKETMEQVKSENKLSMAPESDHLVDNSEHLRDITIEIDRLRDQLNEKDTVISDLQRSNASLLNMLDSKGGSQGESLVDIHKLENEVKSLKIEREQMMDVLNDKSRENSSLKAEVQKLMNIITAQKSALEKLQKDNQELMQKQPEKESGASMDDMQKEVVKNLSSIIRDKDLEIESLKQKNETLLSVLQESSSEGSQINSLMQDKENLTKQLTTLQGEREQMITYLNQKHQESLAYHGEVQRLTAFINSENEKNEKLKHEYETLVPQFEDKNQALLKAQNELINYKQKFKELEVKYGQLLQHSDSEETVDKALYDAKVQENNKLQQRYKELTENLKEKEMKIQNLHQNISELEQNIRTLDSERSSYKKQVDGFNFQVHGLHTEQQDLKSEIAQLKKQKNESMSECEVLKEMNQRLTLQMQEKNFEVESLQEKTNSISQMLKQQQGEVVQVQTMVQDTEATQRHLRQLQQERDQAVLALQHTNNQNSQLTREVQVLKEKEAKLQRELQRLREHLIQIEDGYTKEALAAEEREKELRTRLAIAEEKALSSSSAVENASQAAIEKLDSVQQQLQFVSQQRDQAYLQISSLQDQNNMYTTSMANLQMVLEQFQQEKDRLVGQETEKLEKEVSTLRAEISSLKQELSHTKEQLDEASDGLEAAARLSEQLDRKEEAIDALREEVQIREATLKTAEDELRKLKSRNDDRVDKLVIKNLLLGYFTTPQNKQREVLRAIGGVLLFTSEDFEKIENPHRGGWMPGFLRFGGGSKPVSPPTTPRRSTIGGPVSRGVDNSFSEMFVKFLERESSPPPPAVRLPAEEMARDVQKHKETNKPAYNPFTAPRHVAMPTQSSSSQGAQGMHLLMTSAGTVAHTLPTFAAPSQSSRTPPGSGRNTPATTTSGAILKDVLSR